MGRILSQWRIILASLAATIFVIGAYALALGGRPPAAQASETSALLEAIATKDSTGDGLPDWQKSLYGIPLDATTTDYFNLGMTDGEAVARGLIVPKAIAEVPLATPTASATADPSLPAPAEGTLTDAFAKNFFTLYINAKQAKGGVLSAADTSAIAQEALSNLASSVTTAPPFKSARDLAVSGSGTAALRAFAAAAEAISEKNTANAGKSEIFYLRDAVASSTPGALAAIDSIARSYRETAVGLAALSVPRELADTDLALINALMHISQIVSDFASVNADPLAAMLALEQYPQAVLDLGNAFIGIANAYRVAGVTLAPGAPGASFVNLISDAAASEHAATKTP